MIPRTQCRPADVVDPPLSRAAIGLDEAIGDDRRVLLLRVGCLPNPEEALCRMFREVSEASLQVVDMLVEETGTGRNRVWEHFP